MSENMMNTLAAGCMRWGTWGANLSISGMQSLIEACLSEGINIFDHADIYGHHTTEKAFGKAWSTMRLERSSLKLISKAGIVLPNLPEYPASVKHYRFDAAYIISQCEQSLRNLKTDYLDTLLLHRPSPLMNMYEVAETLHKLMESGKIRNAGVSNFTTQELGLMQQLLPLSVHQFECSLMHTEPFSNGQIQQAGILKLDMQLWSPLGGGATDNNPRLPSQSLTLLKQVANQKSLEMNEVLLLFVAHIPYAKTIIAGSTNPNRLKRMNHLLKTEKLNTEEWFILYEAVRGKEVD